MNNKKNEIVNFQKKLIFSLLIISAFIIGHYLSKIPINLFYKLEENKKLLVQHSKFTAMGEMTALLAHQWRQPLNTVSVLLQEIELKKRVGLLSDDDFIRINENIQKTISFMSKTIDDFKNFFRPSKEKTYLM